MVEESIGPRMNPATKFRNGTGNLFENSYKKQF